MKLEDVENIVPIEGHKGPHPERYHRLVFRALEDATLDCGTMVECRMALTSALRRLARELSTPGTELNALVTPVRTR